MRVGVGEGWVWGCLHSQQSLVTSRLILITPYIEKRMYVYVCTDRHIRTFIHAHMHSAYMYGKLYMLMLLCCANRGAANETGTMR